MYNYTCISLTGDNKIRLLEIWQGHLEPPVGQQTSMNHYIIPRLYMSCTNLYCVLCIHQATKSLGMRIEYMEQIEESDCCLLCQLKICLTILGVILIFIISVGATVAYMYLARFSKVQESRGMVP